MFAHSPAATAEPRWSLRRLRPAPLGEALAEHRRPRRVAGAALGAGAEALTLINTLLGLAIDSERRAPVLGAGGGGLSGDALHSVALRAVYECRAAFPDAGIVGVGGVSDGLGAVGCCSPAPTPSRSARRRWRTRGRPNVSRPSSPRGAASMA